MTTNDIPRGQVKPAKLKKPLKRYRSHAERVAMWQRWAAIFFTMLNCALTILLRHH